MGETPKSIAVPVHVGFIMDGNRRWAKKQGIKIATGHRKGSEALENIAEHCIEAGIKYTTFYSFSTENWKRKSDEVEAIVSLIVEKVKAKAEKLNQMGAKVLFIGRKSDFSSELQKSMKDLEALTAHNNKIFVNFALSYGGQAEIVDAVKEIVESGVEASKVTDELIENHIYEAGQPDLDLIIRTGGQKRLSGFMLWQSTYAELYFVDTLWPDFDKVELEKALGWYAEQKRNFGA